MPREAFRHQDPSSRLQSECHHKTKSSRNLHPVHNMKMESGLAKGSYGLFWSNETTVETANRIRLKDDCHAGVVLLKASEIVWDFAVGTE